MSEHLGSELYLTGLVPRPSKAVQPETKPAKMPSVYHVEIVPDVVVDVYDVANAYSMPAEIAHAFKKIAVPGGRLAGKGEKQDIKEAIWSLNRYLERLERWDE